MAQSLQLLGQVSVNEPSPDRSAPVSGACAQGDFGPYRPGDVIAKKYELLRVISQGGMGWVWVAHHLTLQIETAIKLIRPDLRAESVTERFINEARVAAHVEHPGIVSVYDLGVTEQGDPYIVMELLKGEDLRELLRRTGRLSPVRAVQLLLPIADALATAHARGVVHRDLKPENVFIVGLEQRVVPKIVDFGIAKPGWPCARRLTRAGTVMGSPEYMSPEQAQGREDVDQRVDVWSFCIVLYECLVGRPPFLGNYESTLNEILEKPIVPITELGISEPALWTILSNGLAKQREERWQDMRSLGRALAEWLLERGVEDDVCAQSLRATWLKEPNPSHPERVTPEELTAEAGSSQSSHAPGVSHLPSHDAATLKLSAATPASWGMGLAAGRTARGSGRTRQNIRRLNSARVLALALTLFGVGCAGGSVWLGSTLVLPRPPTPTISGKLLTPARTLCEKLATSRDRGSSAVLSSATKDMKTRNFPAALVPSRGPSEAARGEPGQTRRSAPGRQAPRRAKLPAELEFGF